ncbi:MAG: competence protein ComEA [Frankiaceae bacterium]|nr:competence protein ComEA [Frankiaceae bacterium]
MRIPSRTDQAQTRLHAVLGERWPAAAARSLLTEPVPADDPAPHVPGAAATPTAATPSAVAMPTAATPAAGAAVLPAAVRGGVLDPRRRGALALTAVGVAAAVVAGGLALRARPRSAVVERPAARVVSAPPSASGGGAAARAGSASAAALLVVDVTGQVRRPGLQHLPAGSRVADAVAAAGGANRGGSTAGLNLARKLVDGEQVVVGGPQPASGPASARGAGQPLDLNAATLSDLDQLSGVGPVLAQRILTWRNEHGGFTSVDQLREVEGIGDRKFASLRAQVTV